MNVKVPIILLDKHIVKPPITQRKAKDLSEKRKQSCLESGEVFTNTVFEGPKFLVKCKVLQQQQQNQNRERFHGQVILVSEKKLKTYQCKKNRETSDWTAQEIQPHHAFFAGKSKNFHLLKEFRDFDHVNFVTDNEE